MNTITGRPVGFESDRERFIAALKGSCDDYGLESGSLERYVEHGIKPGDFLTAVLENNFMEAAGRADSFNQLHLHDWARVIYNDVPSACHGSSERVSQWIKAGGLVGLAATRAAA